MARTSILVLTSIAVSAWKQPHGAVRARAVYPISRIASLQTCVLGDPSQPLTREQYADALSRAGSVEELGDVLPQVYGIVDCAFIDNAFDVIIAEECDSLDSDSYGLAAAAFISAISLTLTTFYFCICIQCASLPLPPAPHTTSSPRRNGGMH